MFEIYMEKKNKKKQEMILTDILLTDFLPLTRITDN